MKKMRLVLLAGLALLAFNLDYSMAQDLREGNMNGIRSVSGGIGLGERKALKEMAKDYDLKVVFALLSGECLSGIRVVIKEAGGRMLLETVSNGPSKENMRSAHRTRIREKFGK